MPHQRLRDSVPESLLMPPGELDGARVVCWAVLRPTHQWTGIAFHFDEHVLVDPVPALAICQYAGHKEAYLFLCNLDWKVLQDDLFDSVEDALEQASLRYAGLTRDDWNWPS